MVKLREALQNKLTKEELSHLRASFDVIGDIAIIEIPKELEKKKKVIANTLFKLLKNIKVVACKLGGHIGKYRRQKLEILAGEHRFETIHKEAGCDFKLDVEKCYFSPRLSHERLRAASIIKPKESVYVACSGVAPFPIVFSKHSKAKNIVGVELNPVAHKYAKENLILNKTKNVEVYKGNVCESNKILSSKFDRIFLPAPKEGSTLVQGVVKVAKSSAFLHVYDFAQEDEFKEAAKRVKDACNEAGYSCKILDIVKCGQHAVRTYRVCIDCKIRKKY
jgi:tRNA (guanine37-N1)-methyltransferase